MVLLLVNHFKLYPAVPIGNGVNGLGTNEEALTETFYGFAFGFARIIIIRINHHLTKICNTFNIFECFGRQSNHKIKLYGCPSATKSFVYGI